MMKLVVLCYVIAAAAARAPVYFSPVSIPSLLSASNAALLQGAFYNYRGPLSLAPGQPANILAADGRPLDTLNVNLDRSAHFIAKALENGSHVLKKRSITRLAIAPGLDGFAAAVAAGNAGISRPIAFVPDGITANIATNPISLSAPIVTGPFGVTNPLAVGYFGELTPATTSSIAQPAYFATSPNGGISAPVAAGTPPASTPIGAGSIATSTTFTTSPLGVSAPVAAGALAVSAPVADTSAALIASATTRPIGLLASGTPFVRTF